MLHATFWPFAVSSIPLTKSGAVSNRTQMLAEKVSLSAFCVAYVAPQAGRTRCAPPQESDAVLRASQVLFCLAVHPLASGA